MSPSEETLRRIAAVLGTGTVKDCQCWGCRITTRVARALEAMARCGPCEGNGKRWYDGNQTKAKTCNQCTGSGIDRNRLAAGLAALEGK